MDALATVPTHAEFLANLYQIQRDCLTSIEEAESRGNLNEAKRFRDQLRRINSMIKSEGSLLS